MEHESLEYKIVMDDGPNTEVLARLELAGAAYMGGPRQNHFANRVIISIVAWP
jgi:hypothetical protein